MTETSTRTDGQAYCGCPGLIDLHKKMVNTYWLEGRCNFYSSEVDLDRVDGKDNLQFLRDFRKATDEFRKSVDDYNAELANLVGKGVLRARKEGITLLLECSKCGAEVDRITDNEPDRAAG